MKPWTREKAMQQVARWIYEENPDIWYTPLSITARNRVGQSFNLSDEDATEVFLEMEKRGLLDRHYRTIPVSVTTGGQKSIEIATWELTQDTGKVYPFIEKRGWYRLSFVPTIKHYWDGGKIIWVGIVFVIAAFITGFCTQFGKNLCDRIFPGATEPKIELKAGAK